MFKPLVFALLALTGAALVRADTPAESAAPALNYRMGVATHFAHKTDWMEPWDAAKHIPMIAELGVGWIRDEIVWREVEPEPGRYRLDDNTREWIRIANAHGLKIIAILADRNTAHKDLFDPDAYAKTAAWLATELKGKVHAIEILNEPFGSSHFTETKAGHPSWTGRETDGSDQKWLRRYVTLFNRAADAIKAANPEMLVIGLGSVTPQNYRQIAMGISRSADGITDHPYSFRSPPEVLPHRDTESYRKQVGFPVADADGTFASFIRMYREHLKKHGGPSQIWLTESGWSTFREGDPTRTYVYSGFSEAAQARYVQRRFVEALALDVTVSIHYDFIDDHGRKGGEFNAERYFGLVREGDTPKPSYFALQKVARATVGFRAGNDVNVAVAPFSDRKESQPRSWDGEPLPALNRILAYPFTDAEGRAVFAVWSAERMNDLNVRAATIDFEEDPLKFEIEAVDLMTGASSRPKTKSESGRLRVEQFPVPDYPVLLRLLPKSP